MIEQFTPKTTINDQDREYAEYHTNLIEEAFTMPDSDLTEPEITISKDVEQLDRTTPSREELAKLKAKSTVSIFRKRK